MNSQPAYTITWLLAIFVLIMGLFFPTLMNNDAAEYASIASQMHFRGDWVHILNHHPKTGEVYDYLDKPHLLFWSAMIGFKLFGVHAWSYRLVSVLMCIAAAYAVKKLGSLLYNHTVGNIAAIFFITTQAILLAGHDVKTDSLLTSFVALAVWQFAAYVQKEKLSNMILAGIFLAGGVGTKGLIAVLVTGSVIFFYIAGQKKWRILWNWKWLIGLLSFFIALSPVLYCYYLQFDLHPEKIVNGRTGMSGIKFLLWEQSFERFAGDRSFVRSPEFIFFFHTLLWAFLPWSIICYSGVFRRFAELIRTRGVSFFKREQLSFTGVWVMFCFMSLAKFKLPHYINILFPMLAVFTAAYLYEVYKKGLVRLQKNFLIIQTIIVCLLILIALLLNGWAFPVQKWWIIVIGLLLFTYVIYLLFKKERDNLLKLWFPSAIAILAVNFLLNTNFYPALCKYQAGSEVAFKINEQKLDWDHIYLYRQVSRSFDFYSRQWRPMLTDEMILEKRNNNAAVYLFVFQKEYEELQKKFTTDIILSTPDYRISRLKLKFLNPGTRSATYQPAYLLRIR